MVTVNNGLSLAQTLRQMGAALAVIALYRKAVLFFVVLLGLCVGAVTCDSMVGQ